MSSLKAQSQQKKAELFLEEMDAISPPATSVNGQAREIHDEILILQNVGRVFLNQIMKALDPARSVAWSRFITDYSPHRNISKEDEIEKFLKSKFMPISRL